MDVHLRIEQKVNGSIYCPCPDMDRNIDGVATFSPNLPLWIFFSTGLYEIKGTFEWKG